MSKPRKSWEPVYRFGGDGGVFLPAPLGENQNKYHAHIKKPAKHKKGKRK